MAGNSGNWKLFDNKLIDSVRNKPILFSARLREFRNTKLGENAWLAVSTEVDANGTYYSSRQNRFGMRRENTVCLGFSEVYSTLYSSPWFALHVACK